MSLETSQRSGLEQISSVEAGREQIQSPEKAAEKKVVPVSEFKARKLERAKETLADRKQTLEKLEAIGTQHGFDVSGTVGEIKEEIKGMEEQVSYMERELESLQKEQLPVSHEAVQAGVAEKTQFKQEGVLEQEEVLAEKAEASPVYVKDVVNNRLSKNTEQIDGSEQENMLAYEPLQVSELTFMGPDESIDYRKSNYHVEEEDSSHLQEDGNEVVLEKQDKGEEQKRHPMEDTPEKVRFKELVEGETLEQAAVESDRALNELPQNDKEIKLDYQKNAEIVEQVHQAETVEAIKPKAAIQEEVEAQVEGGLVQDMKKEAEQGGQVRKRELKQERNKGQEQLSQRELVQMLQERFRESGLIDQADGVLSALRQYSYFDDTYQQGLPKGAFNYFQKKMPEWKQLFSDPGADIEQMDTAVLSLAAVMQKMQDFDGHRSLIYSRELQQSIAQVHDNLEEMSASCVRLSSSLRATERFAETRSYVDYLAKEIDKAVVSTRVRPDKMEKTGRRKSQAEKLAA